MIKEMFKKDPVLYYSIGTIVLLLIILFWGINSGKDNGLVGDLDQEVDQEITIPKEEVVNKPRARKITKAPAPTPDYTKTVAEYRDARIQLNEECQAVPSVVTFKEGSSIMIDNRSSFDRRININTDRTIKAYEFEILKLSSDVVPTTWYIDCDGSENVASILIQK